MRMTKETIAKDDGRLLTYYRFKASREQPAARCQSQIRRSPPGRSEGGPPAASGKVPLASGENKGEGSLDPSS